ncbi:MAG TPA: right-handed parallel beta-helix repeat-containing protein, partial [Candidatus Hydrogenedentes bacterium]|nr:right-handed parallel beta-helix repeat-containing protein [Candidatus Hydrogenedentota bacterium]
APLLFAAYEGERAVISGGRPVTGWEQTDGPVWTASVAPEWHFRTLRANGRWLTRARYPNADPDNPIMGGWLFAQPIVISPDEGAFNVNVGNIHNRGDRLEWEIDVPAEGAYTVWVRYGHKMKDYNRENMDNQTVLGVEGGGEEWLVDLPDTGSWAAVRWARAAALHLPAGGQTLYWENKRGGGLTLDAFFLSNDPDWNPASAVRINAQTGEHTAAPPAEGKHTILVQAETCSRAIGPEITIGTPQIRGSNDRVVMKPEDFPDWSNWTGAELHIFPAWGWVNTITAINSVAPEDHILWVNCPQEVRPGNRFFIAGVREALDAPGEWHIDPASGTVSLWPDGFDPREADIVAPVHESLFILEGDSAAEAYVEHVHFRGLTFMDTTYDLDHTYSPANAVLSFSAAAQCSIDACEFTLSAGYALKLAHRSHENRFVRNHVHDVGQGGVIMVGDASEQAHHNLVAANTMTDLGKIYAHVAGAYVTTGSDNRIVHNRIHRVPRYGISLKSYSADGYSHRNLVEFNEIIDSNLETNDTGAIETLGRDNRNTGNIIRYNLIRNVVGLKTTPEGEFLSPHFTWGIYLDDYSSGTT